MKEVKRRNTRQRSVVLNVLKHTRSHPDAEWIYQEARKVIPNMSLGTVYRNLKILKDLKKIIEVKSEFSQSTRYDAVVSPHGHFHCQVCQSIIDVEQMEGLEGMEAIIAENFGVAKSIQVVVHGTCLSCLEGASGTEQ